MQATLQWKMRATPQDKKMIAYAAKHFRFKKSQLIKALVRATYQHAKHERDTNQKQLSPA